MTLHPDTYVCVVNMNTYEAYILDRGYNLLLERIKLDITPYAEAVDLWFGWQCHATPQWARDEGSKNFCAYWLPEKKNVPTTIME